MKIISISLATLALAACADSGIVDELAGETAADEALDGKADGAIDGSYTYFAISGDLRQCAFPSCGGFFLDRLNRSTTKCGDGQAREACYAPELDMGEAGLSAAGYDELVAAANASAGGGVSAIVRGRFAHGNSTAQPELGRFIVTEVWVAQSAAVADGVFVRAKDNGLRCITAPCPTTTERALNTSRKANIAEIDFTPSGLDDDQVGELTQDLFQPYGLIFAGHRFDASVNGRDAKGRTATAVFRRVMDPADAGPCFVGGCSGQVCSDQAGVVTTCEWRDEYACYQTATCERQADGQCGWTPTPELAACLDPQAN